MKRGELRASVAAVGRGVAPDGSLIAWMRSSRLWALGLVGLLVAVAASGLLVYSHFSGKKLPGCGPQSGCDQIESHPFGSLGGMWIGLRRILSGEQPGSITAAEAFWPSSFLGLALFVSLLAAWLVLGFKRGGGVPVWLRWTSRLAALASLGFIVTMLVWGHFCKYCIASHAGNLVFWITLEICAMSTRPQRMDLGSSMKAIASRLADERRARKGGGSHGMSALIAAAGMFALTSGVLGVMHAGELSRARHSADAEMSEAMRSILAKSSTSAAQTNPAQPTSPTTPQASQPNAAPKPEPTPAPAAVPTPDVEKPLPWASDKGFTGRYRVGSEDAAIRVVLFMDYQCPDCKRVEGEIEQFMKSGGGRKDVSLSVKHFPMSNVCNPHLGQMNLHPNACWAARAAEAAGMLKGADGFWAMHHWLFARNGSFTDADFPPALAQLGYDPAAFTQLMQSPETLTPVQNDIEEAVLLGLYFTPMVFVNGVEVRGWEVPGNVKKFLDQLGSSTLAAGHPRDDRPVLADTKLIEDWQKGYVVTLPADPKGWTIGASEADAKATIVFWGDYQEVNTRQVDVALRKAMASRPWVRYAFRPFPTAAACNPVMNGRTIHPMGCLAAQAAEAAGQTGGNIGFWAMHNWLMTNPEDLTVDKIVAAAQSLGLDSAALKTAMSGEAVAAAIKDDTAAASTTRLQSIPWLYLNNRRVLRFTTGSDPSKIDTFMGQLLDTARDEKKP